MNDVTFFSQTRKEGILSFPGETFDGFTKRAQNIKFSKHTFFQENQSEGVFLHPFSLKSLEISTQILLKKSSKGLRLWEAAATWTVDYRNAPLSYVQYKDSKIVPIDELINHEVVHEMRCSFNEKYFEEFLAYNTSQSLFRRVFGPLFISTFESLFFLAAFYTLLICYVFWENNLFLWLIIPLVALPLLRLVVLQFFFMRCLNMLSKVFIKQDPLAIAISLTDREVIKIAFKKESDILTFFNSQKNPRFQQILDTFT